MGKPTTAQSTAVMSRIIAERAISTPDQAIFYCKTFGATSWESYTWSKVAGLVESAIATLVEVGVEKGVVVGLLLPSCVTWEILHLACLELNATLVGLDHHDLGDNFEHVVSLSRLEVLVTDAVALDQIDLSRHRSIRDVVEISLVEEDAPIGDRVVNHVADLPREPADPGSNADSMLEDLATIVFTSGSTGRPKGIGYSSMQIGLAIDAIVDAFPEIDTNSRTICWLPLSNLFQRIVNLSAMRVGAPIYFVSDPRLIMEALPEVRPSVLIAVPRFFEKMFEGIRSRLEMMPIGVGRFVLYAMKHADRVTWYGRVFRGICHVMTGPVRKSFGGAIKFFISGSAAMPPWLLRSYDAMGLPVLEAYGLSENIVPIASNRVSAHRYGSVGVAMNTNELRLAHDNELLCRGPGVCRQYFGSTESLSLDADGFLATGDYAEIDRDGFVWLKGRKSEVFKTNTGRRISPAEIEGYVKKCHAIDHAIVFGAGRKTVIVLVTVALDAEAGIGINELQRIRDCVSDAVKGLPIYKRPAGILIVGRSFSPATGELTANLKLKRNEIETKYRTEIDAVYEMLEFGSSETPLFVHLDSLTYMGRV